MPVIIHAVNKLLNTSGLNPVSYITAPNDKQLLHDWYARLIRTGFKGKLLVMYVHAPSLLTIVCGGKTIRRTWPAFQQRLLSLLTRFNFPPDFIQNEISLMEDYVVAKTNSRSMLAHMNQMCIGLEVSCNRFTDFEHILLDKLENDMMEYPYSSKKNHYTTPFEYWQKELNLNGKEL